MIKDKKSEKDLAELYRTRLSDRKKGFAARKKRHTGKPQKASELLKAFFKDQPETLKKMEEAKALLAWTQYVGPEAAQFSEALKIAGQKMIIQVADPLWMHQLLLLKNQILKCYRRDFPGLKLQDLFFKRSSVA